MARLGKIESKGDVVGLKIRADAIKNKVWYPFKSYEFQIKLMGEDSDFCGVDVIYDLYMEAVFLGVIKKSGSWLSFGDEKIQGEEATITRIRNDPQFRSSIEAEISKKKEQEESNDKEERSQEYDGE